MALPAEEREALALELLHSVDPCGAPDGDEVLIAELERRARAVGERTAELVDWSIVREALRAKLRDGDGAGRAGQDR